MILMDNFSITVYLCGLAQFQVKSLKWLISLRKVNTNYQIQPKLFKFYLSPNWCVLYKNNSEDIDYLFLRCPIACLL